MGKGREPANRGASPAPMNTHKVPPEAHVGLPIPAATIQAATSKRCKLLGSGGFGRVVAAELPDLSPTRVAVKVATSGGVPALIHEASALRLAAAHPCVVTPLGSCWEADHEALVMEYCPGGDLDSYIGMTPTATPPPAAALSKAPADARSAAAGSPAAASVTGSSTNSSTAAPKERHVKQLEWAARLRITYQVASALCFMHRGCGCGQQVLHLDIKPGNILLDSAGNAKLIDFGIARIISPAAGSAAPAAATGAANASSASAVSHPHSSAAKASTKPSHGPAAAAGRNCPASAAEAKLAALAARGVGNQGVVQDNGWAGTPDYLDPLYEQLGQLCDKSDVYSLGLIMCQLLLDNTEPQDAHHILAHALRQRALHLPTLLSDWPADSAAAYAHLALRCCALQREARPTASQLKSELLVLVQAAVSAGSSGGAVGPQGHLAAGRWQFTAVAGQPAAAAGAAGQGLGGAAMPAASGASQAPHQQRPASATNWHTAPPAGAGWPRQQQPSAPGQLKGPGMMSAPATTAVPAAAQPKCAWGKQSAAPAAAAAPAPPTGAWPTLAGKQGLAATTISSGPACLQHAGPGHRQSSAAAAPVGCPGGGSSSSSSGVCSWTAAAKALVVSLEMVLQPGGSLAGQVVLPAAPPAACTGQLAGSGPSGAGSTGQPASFLAVSIVQGSYDAATGQLQFAAPLSTATAGAAAEAAAKAAGASAHKTDAAPAGAGGLPGPVLLFSGRYEQGVLHGTWELQPAAGGTKVWRLTSALLWVAGSSPQQDSPVAAAAISAAAASILQASAVAAASTPAAVGGSVAVGVSPFSMAPAQGVLLTPQAVAAAVTAAVTSTERIVRRLSSCANQHSSRLGSRQHSLAVVNPL